MDLNSRQYVVSLDMTRTGSIRESFEMRHNDDNELIIELRDSAGIIDLNASGVINATLLVTRKDKVDIPLAGTITPEGRASFKLKRASLEKQGMVEVVAQFYFANDVRISTPTLIFNVLRDPSAGAVGDEGDDRTLIEIILNDAPALLEQLQTAYNELLIQKAAFAQFQTDSETAFSNAQNQRITDFNADQTARNTAFEEAQTQRATGFNTSQGERATLFNQAQTARQTDYTTWKDAKDTELNQLASDTENSKLAADGATINANNAATVANTAATNANNKVTELNGYNTRLQGVETETANARQSTVKGKNFANLDARFEELEGDTYKPLQNLVTNGNFANGTTGWVFGSFSSNVAVTSGEGTITQQYATYPVHQVASIVAGRKYFLAALVKNISVTSAMQARFSFGNGYAAGQNGEDYFSQLNTSTFTKITEVITANGNYSSVMPLRFTSSGASGFQYVLDNFLCVDLTAHFGAGKEPSKEEMDELLTVHYDGWFDGTVNVAKKLLERSMQQLTDTFVPLKNEVVNGDFSQGMTGWTPTAGQTISTTENYTGINSLTSSSPGATRQAIESISGDKYYVSTWHKRTVANTTSPIKFGFASLGEGIDLPISVSGWERFSAVLTSNGQNLVVGRYTNETGTYFIDGVVAVNLTKTFGKGNEPTKEEMDRLLVKFPNSFFDGTVNLTPKLLDDLRYLTSDIQMPMKNIIVNSDFSQGTTPWAVGSGSNTRTSESNKLKVESTGTSSIVFVTATAPSEKLGDVIYGRAIFTPTTAKSRTFRFYATNGSDLLGQDIVTNQANIPIVASFMGVRTNILTSGVVIVGAAVYASASDGLGEVFYMEKPIVLNLTEIFGKGNEPTKEQMDALLATYPNSWFDGTVNLAENKRIIPFLLKRLELKADKAPELWLSPTLQNGATVAAGNVLRYRKNGIGQVELHGVITLGTVGLGTVIFNLPAGYRIPSSMILIPAFDGSTGEAVFFRMRSSGNFECMNNLNAGRTYHFSTLFTVIA